MCLAKVDDLPVIFAGHGIDITLAQEAYVVGVLKLIDRGRIVPEFFVVEFDRAFVLQSAMIQIVFAVALDIGGNARRGHGKRNQNQGHHEQHGQQDIAGFRMRR